MRVRTGKLRISAQNSFYTAKGCHVPGSVCTISGKYFYTLGSTAQSDTFAEFLAKTQTEIEDHLEADFFPDAPNVRSNTRGTIIIDMEGEADGHSCHPNDLHLETTADKGSIIAAWKTRIAACRAVFPNARIGMYGLPIPVTKGDPLQATWIARIAAIVQAGTVAGYNSVGSAYDGLDVIIPILYARYGPTDNVGFWTSYDEQADTCIIGAKTILKSDGSAIPIMPLINTYVANGGSNENDLAILDLPTADPLGSTWAIQFGVFKDHGINEVCVWNGINSRYARQGVGESTHLLSKMVHAGRGW